MVNEFPFLFINENENRLLATGSGNRLTPIQTWYRYYKTKTTRASQLPTCDWWTFTFDINSSLIARDHLSPLGFFVVGVRLVHSISPDTIWKWNFEDGSVTINNSFLVRLCL